MNSTKLQRRMKELKVATGIFAIASFFGLIWWIAGLAVMLYVAVFFSLAFIITASLIFLFVFFDVYGDFKSALKSLESASCGVYQARSYKHELERLKAKNPRSYAICEWLARDDNKETKDADPAK